MENAKKTKLLAKQLPPLELLLEHLEINSDWRLVWRKPKPKRKVGALAGGLNGDGYITVGINGVGYLAHRIIWAMHHKELPPVDMVIDHIDRNPLNNNPENLRLCDQKHNLLNRRGNVKSTSKYKGVHWDSGRSRWFASGVDANGTYKALGRFKCEHLAAQRYNEFAVKEHGEYAFLNQIQEIEGQTYGRYFGVPPKSFGG